MTASRTGPPTDLLANCLAGIGAYELVTADDEVELAQPTLSDDRFHPLVA